MKRITKLVAAAFGAVAMFVGSARADYTLTEDETWTDFTEHPGTIDLAGHKLTVSSLAGNATVTSSADAGYEILEYIESDGKAYVNTELAAANNTVIDIKVRLLNALGGSTYVAYVGARQANGTDGQFGGWFHSTKHYKAVTESEGDLSLTEFPSALNTDSQVHLDKAGSCTIDEVEFAPGNGIGSELMIVETFDFSISASKDTFFDFAFSK